MWAAAGEGGRAGLRCLQWGRRRGGLPPGRSREGIGAGARKKLAGIGAWRSREEGGQGNAWSSGAGGWRDAPKPVSCGFQRSRQNSHDIDSETPSYRTCATNHTRDARGINTS
jgi:hypothetical protein